MKKKITILYTCLILSTISSTCVYAQDSQTVSSSTIGVRQFMKHVDSYKDQVTVKGVVSQVFPKHQLLAMIDIEELRECKVTTCAKLTLPVEWKGPMPEILNTIEVHGKVTSKNNRFVFQANNIKMLKGE